MSVILTGFIKDGLMHIYPNKCNIVSIKDISIRFRDTMYRYMISLHRIILVIFAVKMVYGKMPEYCTRP